MLHRGKTHVARRRVFYIPGYDPYPPRRYRELYRTESRSQAKISGFRISQKPLKVARMTRLELAASSVTGWRSNRLSYTPTKEPT